MPEVIFIPPTKATADRKLRMAAYARVSTDSEDQQNSFLTQVDYYTNLICSDPDKILVDIYADEGITGTRLDKREEFNRMLDDCRAGKVDCIITKSISRFARNTLELVQTVRELAALGINVIFEENGINTADIRGKAELLALCSVAQEESISISRNVTMGNQFRMANGTFRQGNAPYGFYIKNGEFIVDPQQAEIVQMIFLAYKEGKSLQKIAQELKDMGIVKQNGRTDWNAKYIAYILTNVRYKGDALHQKTFTTQFPFKEKPNRGERDMYYYKDANPAIVSEELFDISHGLLERQKQYFGRHTEHQVHPLSKMMRCAQCGHLYRRKKRTARIYWVCREHDINTMRCANPQIAEELVYDAFVQLVNRLVQNKEAIFGQMLEQLQSVKAAKTQQLAGVHQITVEIAKLTEQIMVINRLKTQGYIDDVMAAEQTMEINGRIAQLRKDKTTLLGRDACDNTIQATQNILAALGASGAIHSFDEVLFKQLIAQINANGKRLTFVLVNGLHLPVEMGA